MLSPRRAYAQHAAEPDGSVRHVIGRLAFIALVQGLAIAMAATHTVAAPVVVSVTICWTAALLVQLFAALILIASAPRRPITLTRALELLFLGHAPWTLWLLLCGAALTWAPEIPGLSWIPVLAMIVPIAATARIVTAFGEQVLGLSHRHAIRRTLVHQGTIVGTLVAFFSTAVQLWPRIIGALR